MENRITAIVTPRGAIMGIVLTRAEIEAALAASVEGPVIMSLAAHHPDPAAPRYDITICVVEDEETGRAMLDHITDVAREAFGAAGGVETPESQERSAAHRARVRGRLQ